MGTSRKKSWGEMSGGQKLGVVVTGTAQLALAASAWVDLARRPAAQVTGGRKLPWAGVIAISWVGPVTYFVAGRRR